MLIAHYKIAIRRAESGDFQFAKLLFEMESEYVPGRKIEAEFTDKTEAELEKKLEGEIHADPEYEKRLIKPYEETEQILKEASK